MPNRVSELDQQIQRLDVERQEMLEAARELRKRAADQDREWKGLIGKIDAIHAQGKELDRQREKLSKASTAKEEAQKKLATAQQEFEAAKQRLEETQQALAKATEEVDNAAKPIDDMQAELNALLPTIEPIRESALLAEADSLLLHRKIEELETQAGELETQKEAQQQAIESVLRDAGQWISFRQEIAPIFHEKCISCHNARNAKGRYNMANFAAILAEGESGLAIQPGNAQASALYQHVADGSMPYEADPLSESQVQLIERWIDLGARLDASANPEVSLIRIMPHVIQPPPPEKYRAAVPVTALAIDASGKWLASSGYHEVLIWSLPQGELVHRISNVAERVYGLDFHADGQRLAVASGTPGRLGEVKLFNLHSGELLADLLVSEDVMFDVAFSPDGERLAACGADGSLVIFRLADLATPPTVVEDHADWVNSLAWSADSRWLVTASRDKTAKIFDAETGTLQLTFGDHQKNVTAAVFLAEGRQVLSAGDDRHLRVWNVADGKQVREITGLGSEVSGIVLLADDHVATAGADQLVRVHNATDGQLVKELRVSQQWCSSLTGATATPHIYVGDQAGVIQQIETGSWQKAHAWPAKP